MSGGCVVEQGGVRCGGSVDEGAPVQLCEHHFAVAGEWVGRRVGVTDVLPGPCAACGSRLGVWYPSGWLCAICEWRQGEVPDDAGEGYGERGSAGGEGRRGGARSGAARGGGGRGRGGGHPRVDVVYYVRWGDRVKIGTSGNVRVRLGAILHDEVLAFERGGREVEQQRHARFAEYRTPRSEWFAMNDELAEHVRVLGYGALDPWGEYKRWVSELVALRG